MRLPPLSRDRSLITGRALLRAVVAMVLIGAPLTILEATRADALTAVFNIDGSPDFMPPSGSDLVNSQQDNSYDEGAHEDGLCPPIGAGSIPSNKADIANVWVKAQNNHLYLGWSRESLNGTAAVTFELNKSGVDCGNGVNRLRTAGDLLISFNFQGNSVNDAIDVGIRLWIGTSLAGHWGPETLLGSNVAAASISSGFLFGEVEIDLVAAGIFSPTECVSFASAFVKSRSSSEGFNSKLKDLSPPVGTSVTNCAYVKVIKHASPEGSTAFPFTFGKSGLPATVAFNLVDDGGTSGNETWTSPGLFLTNSAYLVTETPPDPTPGKWKLTNATCTGASAWSFDPATKQISVTPGGAVEVVCDFYNTFDPAPTVAVTKTANVTTLNEPGGPVTYTVNVWNTSNEAVTVTSLTDTVGASTANLLASATNTDCDTVGRSLSASNGASGGADTMTCTFTVDVIGNASFVHNNRVDAIVTDDEDDTATAFDTESVSLLNVLPTLDVTKTAGVSTLPEPGGAVTYTASAWNTSNEAVTVTSLTDTIGANIANLLASATNTNCDTVSRTLSASNGSRGGADTMSCTFTLSVTGNAGSVHNDRVDAVVTDDDNTTATDFDTATVTLTDVAPTVDVTKNANVTTRNEPGGPVTYTVSVWNTANEAVAVTSLTDTIGADVANLLASATNTNCDTVSRNLAASDGSRGGADTMSCTFSLDVIGNAGSVHTDRVDAVVTDDDQSTATDFDTATVTLLNVLPTLDVTKVASVSTLPEPGGAVTFTVSVWNTSNEGVTVTSLTDTIGADVANLLASATNTNCDTVSRTLAASDGSRGGADTMSCTFTLSVAGNAGFVHNDRVDAVVTDDDQTTATDFDTATVTLTDVAPTLDVTKTASPTSMPEPGGLATFTVSVWNTSPEAVTVTSLTDTVGADIANLLASASTTDCDTMSRNLAASNGSRGGADTMSCTFSLAIAGNAGFVHADRVDATVTDNDATTATDFDTATVTLTNVLPTIDVTKVANVESLPEPGGPVAYSVTVWNTSNEAVTVTSLTDTVGAAVADLLASASTSDCDTAGRGLAASDGTRGGPDTLACSFTVNVAGNAGDVHANRVDAIAVDDDASSATDFATESVSLTDVAPTLDVTKTPDVDSVSEPGAPVTYTVTVWNTSNEGVTVTSLTDTVGADVANLLASALNTDCDTVGRSLAASDGTRGGADTLTCAFTINVTGNAGDVHVNRVDAVVTDDDQSSATDFATALVPITNVDPTVEVTKRAGVDSVPEPGAPVTFTVSVWNTSNEGATVTSLTDTVGLDVANLLASASNSDCDTADGHLAASDGSRGGEDTMTCTFTIDVTGNAGDIHLDRVDVTLIDDDEASVTDFDTAIVTVTDVPPTILVTKTAAPSSVSELGGVVSFSVTVHNISIEGVTLTSLTDDVFGDLNGVGDCAIGGAIVAGGTYECSFAKTMSGDPAIAHHDTVTAIVVDDDDTTATNHDDATVTFTDVLPSIHVEKSASAPVVISGDTVTYTYVVTNTGGEPLSNVTIADNKCATVAFVGGDSNVDQKLDVAEAWSYSCAQALTADTTNVVTVTGDDDDGNTATDEDTESVVVINPKIAVDKSANVAIANPGQSVTYSYKVTNPGNDPLSSVTVVDDKCAPVTLVDGDTDADAKLDSSETWNYTCTQVVTAVGSLTNVVVVTGTPTVGPKVNATDTVTIPITAVLGEVLSRTGANSSMLASQALAILALGAALLLLGRRRVGGRVI